MKWLMKLLDRRRRAAVRSYAEISEAELLARLGGAAGSPVYLALRTVIDEETLRHTNDMLEEGIPEAVLRCRQGKAMALAELVAELEERIRLAREREAEKEQQQAV